MDPPLKRNIYPLVDWKIFLKESKKEFVRLYKAPTPKKYNREDFDFLRVLGSGAFGRVYLALLRQTGQYYAIKQMGKGIVIKNKQVENALQEKKILQALNFPFCVYLEMSFQNYNFIYMGLPFAPAGDLFDHLREKKRFNEDLTKFYGAQILLALEYIHHLKMVYRDIKPENIVLDGNGYLKITDFGFCKIIKDNRTYTFCGTPEYLAPEIILQKGYGKAVDWWSFGVILYEMCAGSTPFYDHDHLKVYEKIICGRYQAPFFFSADLADLIENLLRVDLSMRYGNLVGGVDDIKDHPWFRPTDWIGLFNNVVPAPYVPTIQRAWEYHDKIVEKSADKQGKTDKNQLYTKLFEEF